MIIFENAIMFISSSLMVLLYLCRQADIIFDQGHSDKHSNLNKPTSPKDIGIPNPSSSATPNSFTSPGQIGISPVKPSTVNKKQTDRDTSRVEELSERVIRLIPKWAEEVYTRYILDRHYISRVIPFFLRYSLN